MIAEKAVNGRPALTLEELRAFMRPAPWRAFAGVLRVYGLLIGTIAGALWLGGVWLIPAILLIAALQHALSILQHEAVHGLICPNRKWNDFIGAWVLSYPIGFTMAYRTTHFGHHRNLGEDTADPDAHIYAPFPMSRKEFFKKMILAFSGIEACRQFLRGGTATTAASVISRVKALGGVVLVQGIILAGFVLAGHPLHYILLWLVPLVTLAKGFTYLRSVAEHLIRIDAVPSSATRIRTFQSSLFERFFLAPLNFHIHAEHHWYPQVPYSRLPTLRRVLKTRAGYEQGTEQAKSYLSVLWNAIQPHPTV